MPSVGQELLDVPFAEMVEKLATGIAAAQASLDANSVDTATQLAETTIPLVLNITQVIAADGTVSFPDPPAPVDVSLIQIGLLPTFYQFAETTIEVKIDIKTTTSGETNVRVDAQAKAGFAVWSASVRVDVSHNRKFGREVTGSSRLFTRLVPVPPPPRIAPTLTVVDQRPTPGGGTTPGGGGTTPGGGGT
jgi:hypothetical protein